MKAAYAAYSAEAVGTAALLVAIVGSGIMGEQLSAGNIAIALLANSLATGAMLFVLITLLAPISGAHFNPLVSFALCATKQHHWHRLFPYCLAQVMGAIAGVFLAHAMFNLSLLQISAYIRDGSGIFIAEIFASLGLLLTIFGGMRSAPTQIPSLVATYTIGAYWFTSSTSFANPAVTLARSLTNTFAGIAPQNVAAFIGAQTIGLVLMLIIFRLARTH